MKSRCPFCNFPKTNIVGPVDIGNKSYSVKSSLRNCKRCGLHWTDPFPNEEQLSQIYAGIYHYNPNKLRDFLVSLYTFFELQSDFRLIEKFRKEGKVLDIGAGRGDFLLKFSPTKWERWAFDPYLSKVEIRQLREKIGRNVNNYARLQDYPNSAFDVVILRNVIEHTTDFSTLLQESHRILKKKGLIFIRTPNMRSLDFKTFKNNWYIITMPGHIVFFDKKSLSEYTRIFGFRIKFNRPTSRSALLSFFRSSGKNIPIPAKLGLSFLYSLFSPFFGEGGDLRMIAQKN